MKTRTYSIYAYKNTANNEIIYVGQTVRDPYERFLDRFKPSNYYKAQLNYSLQEGDLEVEIITLATTTDKRKKNALEEKWIKHFRPRFNIYLNK